MAAVDLRERPSFNWKRAAAEAVIPPIVLFGYFVLRGTHLSALTIAAASAFWVVTAIPASYLTQTGRRAAGMLVSVATVAAMFGAASFFKAKTAAVAFTDDERAPLEAVGDGSERRLRHPVLGWSILHPGPGFVAVQNQAFRPDAQFYAFDDVAQKERVAIGLFKGKGESAASLRDLLEAMRHQIGGAGRGAAASEVVTSEGPPATGTLRATATDGRAWLMRAYGWTQEGRAPFAVLISATTSRPDAYAAVMGSFRP